MVPAPLLPPEPQGRDSRVMLRSSRKEAPLLLPCVFGRYLLFDFIGRGGMADIYLARAETDFFGARRCVVKNIAQSIAGIRAFSDMFIFEAKLAARLNHANIVQVFDLGRWEEHLFIAMDYVEGYDLNALLRLCTREKVLLPLEFALHVVREVLVGLDYAHRAVGEDGTPLGIVHRDVSPSNVLLSLEGEVKLCDFGIARANELLEPGGPLFEDALAGKAGYMSPEHAAGSKVDARADVFSAGILLWELLSGRRMYKTDGDNKALLSLARQGDIPPLHAPGIPGELRLRQLVARALAFDPGARFPSARAMLRELDETVHVEKLHANPVALGRWLREHFGARVVEPRADKEAEARNQHTPPMALTQPKKEAPPRTAADEPDMSSAETPSPLAAVGAPPAPGVTVRERLLPRWVLVAAFTLVGIVALLLAR